MKKLFCILLVGAMLLSGCDVTEPQSSGGLDTAPKEETVTTLEDISLLYYPDADPNPLTSTNLTNQKLYRAIYLPLLIFDEKMGVRYGCAASHSISGKTIEFKLDTDRTFSDGTKLSGQIVKACFDSVLANPESPYYAQLSNVQSVSGDSGSVRITLKENDPDALYCMDIPIVKTAGSSDAPAYYGCGDYMFGRVNGSRALVANDKNKSTPLIATIYLLEPRADSDLTSMFNSGVLDVLPTDLLSNHVFSASRNYNIKSYLTNHMIYLGANGAGSLKSSKVRAAFSKLLPREDIVKSILMQQGKATARPFYPNRSDLPGETLTNEDSQIFKAFTDAGFKEKSGNLTHADGSQITLKLLVCSENKTHIAIAEKIKSTAFRYGIQITLESVDEKAFLSRLQAGEFDVYLAGYTLPKNMDPTPLFAADGNDNYGKISVSALDSSFASYKNGKTDLTDFLAVFEKEMPILPIAFTANTIYLTEGVKTDSSVSFSAPLGDPAAWSLS